MTRGELSVNWSGRHAVVTMPAELDTANSAEVSDLLSAVTAEEPDMITGDLTRTMFCDSAGVHAIARACERAALGGTDAGCGHHNQLQPPPAPDRPTNCTARTQCPHTCASSLS